MRVYPSRRSRSLRARTATRAAIAELPSAKWRIAARPSRAPSMPPRFQAALALAAATEAASAATQPSSRDAVKARLRNSLAEARRREGGQE